MNYRPALIVSVAAISSLLIIFQVVNVVRAQVGDTPITSPVTSPEVSPTPSVSPSASPSATPTSTPSATPIASPSSSPSATPNPTPNPDNFSLAGTVKLQGFFHKDHSYSPEGITIEAKGFFTHKKYTTKTDSNGNYEFSFLPTGLYLVSLKNSKASMVKPVFRSVRLVKNISNANFAGLVHDSLF